MRRKTFAEQLAELKSAGYRLPDAQAKVAHDAVLYAMHKCGFKKNGTIKGGVVMCEITKDVRRTTMDLDMDFIRYSISERSIRRFVARLAKASGYRISIFGTIAELKQDDYRGKRMFLSVSDGSVKNPLMTKVDVGVHARREIPQVECAFAALAGESDKTLLANSKEQIFTEKLLSLLRHGFLSTRGKDIYDMFYLMDKMNLRRLRGLVTTLVTQNRKCPIREPESIVEFIAEVFGNRRFVRMLSSPDSNWLQVPVQKATSELLGFIARVLKFRSPPVRTQGKHRGRFPVKPPRRSR